MDKKTMSGAVIVGIAVFIIILITSLTDISFNWAFFQKIGIVVFFGALILIFLNKKKEQNSSKKSK